MITAYTFSDADARRFLEAKAERIRRYAALAPQILEIALRHQDEIAELRRDGVLVLPELLPRGEVIALGQALDRCLEQRIGWAPVRDHRAELAERRDLRSATIMVSDAVLAAGLSAVRERSNGLAIADPLVRVEGALDLALHREILERAVAYFECVPKLTFAKLRASFANDVPPTDTQLFHADSGSFRIFKALIYLQDVSADGGPFEYVSRSHRERFEGWSTRHRFDEEELRRHYGDGGMRRIPGRAGDVILAEATGFHRGRKPISDDRGILIVNFCVHDEYGFDFEPLRIERERLEKLEPLARAAAGGLLPVDAPRAAPYSTTK